MFSFFFVTCRTRVLLVLAPSINSIYFSLFKKKTISSGLVLIYPGSCFVCAL
jgi:hypothetical protein